MMISCIDRYNRNPQGKPMSQSNPEKIVTINRVYPPDLETRHANNIVVQHDQDNFFLSFFDVWVPIIIGTNEEKERQIEAVDSIDAKCVARIILSPSRALELINLLTENIRAYESRFNLKRDSETE